MAGILNGKYAMVTGSNRGIGLAIVKAFASEGCNVWACARSQNDEFEREMDNIANYNGVEINPLYFDVRNTGEMKNAIKDIQKSKKELNVLVNCAGVINTKLFQMTRAEEFKDVFDVNFFAPLELTRYALKLITRAGGGSIINLASIAGLDPHPTNAAYGSSKAAMIMFTKILATEVAGANIRVNAIAPGNTDTDMIQPVIEMAGEKAMHDMTAMGRFAEPKEVADVAVFLASDRSSFINGEVVRVDGGMR